MLLRFLGYFSYLRKHFGTPRAFAFMLFYTAARIRGDQKGKLHRIPVGPYVFYFPLVEFFAGIFNEIFFNGEYYIAKTTAPIRVIDAGANIGVALLYIKLQAPNARVTCFEPNLEARAVLEKNIAANGWEKSVDVLPCALGAQSGTADFFLNPDADTDSSGSLVETANSKNTQRSFTVSVEPLSRYLTEPVDYLKLDIEGAEFDVLTELKASNSFARITYIQIEYHDLPTSRPLSELLQLLEHEGFKTSVQNIFPTNTIVGTDRRRNCIVSAWRSGGLS